MRVLFRVALALLIAIPVYLALVLIFAVEARRGSAASLERRAPSRESQVATRDGAKLGLHDATV
jgi:hypothetical protein